MRVNATFRLIATLLLAVGILLGSSACVTYGGGVESGLLKMRQGDYAGSAAEMEKSLKPDGDDRLLHHMELGLLKHLAGRYKESNRHLAQAERIADNLYTRNVGDMLSVAMSNPRNGPYRGADFERVFIHYYRSLNYLMLAVAKGAGGREALLESAAVEARKVDVLLGALVRERGDYGDSRDEQSRSFSKMMDVFRVLAGRRHDPDWLTYREDAYLRYVTGLIYELNGSLDDARIAYQKAAELYESGYAKQYGLGQKMAELAWFDTIRMMRQGGGWESEWPALARKKLSAASRKRLESFGADTAQVVVIQHLGLVPHRGELDLRLSINKRTRELVLIPLYGNGPERKGKFVWFQAMYADRGLLGLVKNYQSSGVVGAVVGTVSKRFPLSPVWNLVEDLKLDEALGDGIGTRVTVPYYPPIDTAYGASELWLDGSRSASMVDAQSLAQLALQEQILAAGGDLSEAVAREALKSVLANEASKSAANGNEGVATLFKFAGKLAVAASSAAETRNWLTLPQGIRVQRLALSPGKHKLTIRTSAAGGGLYHESEKRLKLTAGEMRVITVQSLIAPRGSR